MCDHCVFLLCQEVLAHMTPVNLTWAPQSLNPAWRETHCVVPGPPRRAGVCVVSHHPQEALLCGHLLCKGQERLALGFLSLTSSCAPGRILGKGSVVFGVSLEFLD